MGGFFGGGTKVTPGVGQPTASPAQEAYTAAITPAAQAEASTQATLSSMGATELAGAIPQTQSDLINALQLGPYEAQMPAASAAAGQTIGAPLANTYGGVTQQNPYVGQSAELSTQLGKDVASRDASATVNPQISAGNNLANVLANRQAPTAASSSVDAQALLQPLTQNFTENVLPSIQAQAIGAGAIGGGRQQDLVKQASEAYGTNAANALEAGKAGLLSAETGAFGADTAGKAAAGGLYGQGGQLGLGAFGQNLGAAQAAGTDFGTAGSIGLGADTNAVKQAQTQGLLAPVLDQLYLQGTQAGVNQDVTARGLSTQRAQVPTTLSNVLLSGGAGIPVTSPSFSPLVYPGSTTQGTSGAQAGAGLGSILSLLNFSNLFGG